MSFSWGHPRLCLTFCSWQIKNDSCLSISIHSSVFFLNSFLFNIVIMIFLSSAIIDIVDVCWYPLGADTIPSKQSKTWQKRITSVSTHILLLHTSMCFFLYLFPLLPPLERFHVMDTSDGEGGEGRQGGGRTHPEGRPGYITAASIFFPHRPHLQSICTLFYTIVMLSSTLVTKLGELLTNNQRWDGRCYGFHCNISSYNPANGFSHLFGS